MNRLSAWRALWLALGDPFRMGGLAALSAFLLFWVDTARLFATTPGGNRWISSIPGGDGIVAVLARFGWSDVIGLAVAVAFFVCAAPRALRRAGVTMAPAKPSERAMFVAIGVVVMYLMLTILAYLAEQSFGVAWHAIPLTANDRVFVTLWGHLVVEAMLIWIATISILMGAEGMEVTSPHVAAIRATRRPMSLLTTAALFGTLTGLWIIAIREILIRSRPDNVGEVGAMVLILGVLALITSYAMLVKLAFITRLHFDRDALPETAGVFD